MNGLNTLALTGETTDLELAICRPATSFDLVAHAEDVAPRISPTHFQNVIRGSFYAVKVALTLRRLNPEITEGAAIRVVEGGAPAIAGTATYGIIQVDYDVVTSPPPRPPVFKRIPIVLVHEVNSANDVALYAWDIFGEHRYVPVKRFASTTVANGDVEMAIDSVFNLLNQRRRLRSIDDRR